MVQRSLNVSEPVSEEAPRAPERAKYDATGSVQLPTNASKPNHSH